MARRVTRRDFLNLAAMAAAAPLFEMKPLWGIDFILQNSPTARRFLIETMPGDIALFDYNNDGLLDYDNDGDGFTDIFVANDGMQQYLFHNNGDGPFTECALESGVALTSDGKGFSGMGTVFQDYENDGRPDVLVTLLPREIYGLYHNEGGGAFNYVSLEAGLSALTSGSSGWGAGREDFDHDGWKDLFVAQGHMLDNVQQIDASLRYKELPPLAINHNGHFERAGSGVTTPLAAPGAAFGDINNDGKMDVVLSILGGPPVLCGNHWLSISLWGTPGNRDAYGARVLVNGQTRFATNAGGYVCANDKRLHFGLGTAEKATVEIHWPSGVKQVLSDVRSHARVSGACGKLLCPPANASSGEGIFGSVASAARPAGPSSRTGPSLCQLGAVAEGQGRISRAETKLHPGKAEAAYRWAALLQQGKASEALPELECANELKPEMPERLYSLGKAASLVGDSATVEKSWLKVVEIEKSTSLAEQAHFELAGLYRKQGKGEQPRHEMQEFQKRQSTIGPPRSE